MPMRELHSLRSELQHLALSPDTRNAARDDDAADTPPATTHVARHAATTHSRFDVLTRDTKRQRRGTRARHDATLRSSELSSTPSSSSALATADQPSYAQVVSAGGNAATASAAGCATTANDNNSKHDCDADAGVPCRITTRAPYTRLQPQPFAYLLVCDFEATCDADSAHYPHEIIEFPVVVLDTATLCIVAEFHSYVRPVRRPRLTRFCTELTGITQDVTDAADTLPVVLARFVAWLHNVVYPMCRRRLQRQQQQQSAQRGSACATPADHVDKVDDTRKNDNNNDNNDKKSDDGSRPCATCAGLSARQRGFAVDASSAAARAWRAEEQSVCFATDGPWDMRRFMYECSVVRDGVDFPPLFYRYVNVRKCYSEQMRQRPIKLATMLRRLHMTFDGRPHCGLDDARNIARVLAEVLARGLRIRKISTIPYVRALATDSAPAQATAPHAEGTPSSDHVTST